MVATTNTLKILLVCFSELKIHVTLTLDARDEVNHRPCAYHLNGTDCYLFAQLTIECDSFDNYRVYIWNLNSGTGDDSMQQFGCDMTDCDVFGMWEIPDECPTPTALLVSLIQIELINQNIPWPTINDLLPFLTTLTSTLTFVLSQLSLSVSSLTM